METRPRNSNINRKGSRKFANKSDNIINTHKKSKGINKNILKTRGLYVVRNPDEIKIDTRYDDPKANAKVPTKQRSQRKFSASVVTSSIIGNRKFITHKMGKTKNKNLLRPDVSRTEQSALSNNYTDGKSSAASRNRANNIDDGIIYVMPTRGNKDRSLTITDSSMSKRDSLVSRRDSLVKRRDSLIKKRDSLVSKRDSMIAGKRDRLESNTVMSNDETLLTESFCAGADRIAAEVLEGWIKRKEKKDPKNNARINEDLVDEVLYDLCVDVIETTLNDTDYQERPTSSKNADKAKKRVAPKKATFDGLGYVDTDIKGHDYNVSDRFYITESIETLTPSFPKRKRTKVLANKVLRSGYKARQHSHRGSSRRSDVLEKTYKHVREKGRRNFLNTIKRELHTCYQVCEEPQNMFEALKALATAKSKTAKHITFDGYEDMVVEDDDVSCKFKSPKLLQRFPHRKYRFMANKKNRQQENVQVPYRQTNKENYSRDRGFGAASALHIRNFYRTPDETVHVIT